MKPERPDYEFPVYEHDWTGAPGQPAGIYYLDGRCTLAAHGSPAEERLVAGGAIHVATVLFEPDPREGRIPGRAVAAVTAADLLASLAGPGGN